MKQMIYILSGLPGSGKTTYAQKLAKESNGIVFSTDAWMTDLFWMDKRDEDGLDWALERTQRCETRMIATCAQLQALNVSAILDIGFVNLECRQQAYKKLASFNLDYEIRVLQVNKEIRWQRVEQRNQTKSETYSFHVSREMFEFMESHFDPFSSEETNKTIRYIKG